MKSQDELDIEREISSLEDQIVGLRRALSIMQKHQRPSSLLQSASPAPPAAAVSTNPPILRLEPEPEVKIRSGSNRDLVREALPKVGEKFTPTDIDNALKAMGQKLTRVQITTILSRLQERHEIYIQRNGIGGIEPIYSKTPKGPPPRPTILAQ